MHPGSREFEPGDARPAATQVSGYGHSFALAKFLHPLQAMRTGDFSVRLPTEYVGLEGKVCDTFIEIVAANARMPQELEHVGQVVAMRSTRAPA